MRIKLRIDVFGKSISPWDLSFYKFNRIAEFYLELLYGFVAYVDFEATLGKDGCADDLIFLVVSELCFKRKRFSYQISDANLPKQVQNLP